MTDKDLSPAPRNTHTMKPDTSTKAKFLFSVIRPYKHIAILVIVFSILASGFDGLSIGIFVPLLSSVQNMQNTHDLPGVFQWLATFFKPYQVEHQIYLAIGVVVAASLLKNTFLVIAIRLGHWLSTRLLADLRLRAMRLLLTVSIAFHHKSRAGDLIDRAVYNPAGVELALRYSIEFIANMFTFFVLLLLLFLLSWQLMAVTVLIGIVFFVFMHRHTKSLSRLGRTAAATNREVVSAVHESLSGIQLIKSYSQEQRYLSWIGRHIEASRKIENQRRFKIFSIHPITDAYATIAVAILCIFALRLYRMDTTLMLTQLLPFMYVLLRMVPLLKILNNQRVEIIGQWPQVGLVYELLREDNKPFIPDGKNIFPGVRREIQFRNVTFAYPGHETPVLRDVSFSIPASKITAIIGESGTGKSTIAHLLLRFYDPQQGEILFDGEPLPRFQLESYHRQIGVVSQDTFLFNNTVKYNIAFSAEGVPSEEHIIDAAKRAGAHEFIMELPNGYDTSIGDRGVKLSGGQRQRLSIARAILCNPQVLILDEATSALDAQTERRIHEAIVELSQGRTVIIIAHRLSTIKSADQIVVLKHGQVAEAGPAEKLFEQHSEYYRLASSG